MVSLARYANTISTMDIPTQDKIYESYWHEIGNIKIELLTLNWRKEVESKVIWENLREGILKIDD